MSRFAALFRCDGRLVERAQLLGMVAPLRRNAAAGPRLWIHGAAGLAYQGFRDSAGIDDQQPCTAREIAICFDGRLDNREELAGLLEDELQSDPRGVSDAQLALSCYFRFGDMFAGHLLGDFSLALFDTRNRKLVLARDPLGIRPLYAWQSSRTFVAASEIKAILAHPEVESRPDELTIVDVLVGGDPNELRRTFFADVHRILPGHTVVVDPGGAREFRHWDFDVSAQTRYRSVTEYSERLRELFIQAVRRRLRPRGPVAVKVSGGLDSSAIFCAAEKLKRSGTDIAPAVGISMVFPDGTAADEKRYLNDIEALYRSNIRRLPYSSFEFTDGENWLREIEYPRFHWNSDLDIFEVARQSGCNALLDGYFGDQMMASDAHLFELARKLRIRQLRRDFKILVSSMQDGDPILIRQCLVHAFLRNLAPDWLLRPYRVLRNLHDPNFYPRWFSQRLLRLAYQRCQQQRRPKTSFASQQAEICYRYFLAPHRLDSIEQTNKMAAAYGMTKAYPFMDRDLVSFVMSVPGSMMNLGGVFKGLFREAMRGILPDSIRERYWKADFTDLNASAATGGQSRSQRLLRPDCMAVRFGYLDPASLSRALKAHRATLTGERLLPIVQFNSLVGLEVWLRAFFQNSSSSEKTTSAVSSLPDTSNGAECGILVANASRRGRTQGLKN